MLQLKTIRRVKLSAAAFIRFRKGIVDNLIVPQIGGDLGLSTTWEAVHNTFGQFDSGSLGKLSAPYGWATLSIWGCGLVGASLAVG